jgi:hypothetical protein
LSQRRYTLHSRKRYLLDAVKKLLRRPVNIRVNILSDRMLPEPVVRHDLISQPPNNVSRGAFYHPSWHCSYFAGFTAVPEIPVIIT